MLTGTTMLIALAFLPMDQTPPADRTPVENTAAVVPKGPVRPWDDPRKKTGPRPIRKRGK